MTASRVAPRWRFLTFERRELPSTVVFCVLLIVAAVSLLYAGRHLTFFYDEWTFIRERRGSGLNTYLDPHNGHLSLVPVLIYKALFELVGLRHYTPYRVVGVALQLIGVALLYLIFRRRIGPWLALAPTLLLLFMGTAFQDLLWPFQIGYLGSLAAGFGALALLDDPPVRREGWTSALLVCSVASSGVGICFLLATVVMLLAQRLPWRSFWVPALPLALYLIWYVGWGTGDSMTSDAVLAAPQYVANAAAGVAAGIAGLDDASWGAPLALALLAVISLSWYARKLGDPTPMLLAGVAGVLSFWILTAVTRAAFAEPAASRYLYVGATFVWLIVAESRVGVEWRPVWLGLAGLLVLGALVANLGVLRAGERGLRGSDTSVQTSLAAVNIAAPAVSPAFVPDPTNAPQLTAGAYLAAAHDLGSPAYTIPELEAGPETVRAHADQVLTHAEELSLAPVSSTTRATLAPTVTGAAGGAVVSQDGCARFEPGPNGGYVDLSEVPSTGLVIGASGGSSGILYVRRFGSGFDNGPLGSVGSRRAILRFPSDRASSVPWRIRIGAQRPLTVCGV